MFTRVRWFLYGALVAIGASAYFATKVKRMRERLTAANMAKAGALTAADGMEAIGRMLVRSGSGPTSPSRDLRRG